ncbi:Inactive rhomboid protein 1 [Melipona quadrifasciata]|uniref:Inactive rhomboid protein 1 n=1 Tax=Melipona quadrifasciata TaxID=166423 RepID=A0A0N0U3B5_9HYME|nr:Inactive rhomboid protein 1 [Melipona quadrifasciata]
MHICNSRSFSKVNPAFESPRALFYVLFNRSFWPVFGSSRDFCKGKTLILKIMADLVVKKIVFSESTYLQMNIELYSAITYQAFGKCCYNSKDRNFYIDLSNNDGAALYSEQSREKHENLGVFGASSLWSEVKMSREELQERRQSKLENLRARNEEIATNGNNGTIMFNLSYYYLEIESNFIISHCLGYLSIIQAKQMINLLLLDDIYLGDIIPASSKEKESDELLYTNTIESDAATAFTPLLLEVYATPPREPRDPNQPIANFRCTRGGPKISGLPPLKSLSVIITAIKMCPEFKRGQTMMDMIYTQKEDIKQRKLIFVEDQAQPRKFKLYLNILKIEKILQVWDNKKLSNADRRNFQVLTRESASSGGRTAIAATATAAPTSGEVLLIGSNDRSSSSNGQPSPGSGTTGTSTVSSNTADGENGQSIGLYPVGSVGPTPTNPTTATAITTTATISLASSGPRTQEPGPSITRSASAPTAPRPVIQVASTSGNSGSQKPRLRRTMSRTEAIRKRETAQFFGVDEESEALERQRWLDRRRRMASRKYGALVPEHRPPDPDITRDVPDTTDVPESRRNSIGEKNSKKRYASSSHVGPQRVKIRCYIEKMAATSQTKRFRGKNDAFGAPLRRRESQVEYSYCSYLVTYDSLASEFQFPENSLDKFLYSPNFCELSEPQTRGNSNKIRIARLGRKISRCREAWTETACTNTPLPRSVFHAAITSHVTLTFATMYRWENIIRAGRTASVRNKGRKCNQRAMAITARKRVSYATPSLVFWWCDNPTMNCDKIIRRGRSVSAFRRGVTHIFSWEIRLSLTTTTVASKTEVTYNDGKITTRSLCTRRHLADNRPSDFHETKTRRGTTAGFAVTIGQSFGIPRILFRGYRRSFRKSVSQKPDVRKQLDDFEDHRPYFTYWITTVQVLILIISLACYGFGPVGMDLSHRSGLVLVTSLSLQQVDYQEPANFWFGPRAADLIHLGAKFAPCMRRDIKILKEIDVWRERERDTACCIRNDDSGCVQSSKADCSNTISTWKKWGPGDSGPGGRISGSVCGLDPKFCDAPASIAPYEWPDDITKWPICRKTNPFNQRFRNGSQRGNGNFPVGRYKDKMAEHMVCEVIGHPCCIGIHGMCRITTKEYCDFVHGYFHEEASLCSQVECLHDVCGMIPFLHPEWPDQFYRLFTTMFLHAGILHLSITLMVQYFLMRDLEKLTGSLRIALIYFIGALAGNLASAIFVPYRAEVRAFISFFTYSQRFLLWPLWSESTLLQSKGASAFLLAFLEHDFP